MVKQNKTICIDSVLIEELEKVKSASALINNLLLDYFNSSGHLKKEELKKKLADLEFRIKNDKEDMEIIKKQIEKIKNDENRIREVFKNIPKEIMDDFNFFEKMTIDTCFNRFKEVWNRKYNLKWEEIKKAFCELKGINKEERIKEENA